MRKQAIMFDLDGTILNRKGSLERFIAWQATHKLKSTVKNANSFIERFIELDNNGHTWKDEVYAKLIDEFHLSGWTAEQLTSTYVSDFCNFCAPRKGVPEAIEFASKLGLKIGLVSNGKSPFQEHNFQSLGLTHLFDDIIVSEAVGLRKPDRRIFELACRNLETEPGSSIFVGDNPVADIKGAKMAGMQTIYLPEKSDAAACEYSDIDCRDTANLPDAIATLSSVAGFTH